MQTLGGTPSFTHFNDFNFEKVDLLTSLTMTLAYFITHYCGQGLQKSFYKTNWHITNGFVVALMSITSYEELWVEDEIKFSFLKQMFWFRNYFFGKILCL